MLRTAIASPVWRGGSSALVLAHRTEKLVENFRRVLHSEEDNNWRAPGGACRAVPSFMTKATVQRPLDRLAIALAGLCLVHCLLTPIALVLFPMLAATSVADEQFHTMLLWLVLPASLVALALGCRRHKDHLVISLGWINTAQHISLACLSQVR